MDNQMNWRLERLRCQLVAVAMHKKNMLHREVLLLSQSLDQLIVIAQREKLRALQESK
ncbi:Spo0E family sporulation regulatory protein-aspartic acid phosphatase [Paenibacillus sp. GCM10027626]|uniref:Spo0E family sporulation regulatory protein-aspartic acid phosphatase n=1 Tax=Paenibacillus sp. GCM10027626 TaxID=3273411 RepID=UPI00362BAE8C